MAEKNQNKITEFEKEMINTAKKITIASTLKIIPSFIFLASMVFTNR